jgi:hypothetical protein
MDVIHYVGVKMDWMESRMTGGEKGKGGVSVLIHYPFWQRWQSLWKRLLFWIQQLGWLPAFIHASLASLLFQ